MRRLIVLALCVGLAGCKAVGRLTTPRHFDAAGRFELFLDGAPRNDASFWMSDDEGHVVVQMPESRDLVFVSFGKSKAARLDPGTKITLSSDGQHLDVDLPLTSNNSVPTHLAKGPAMQFQWGEHLAELRYNTDVLGRHTCKEVLKKLPEMERARAVYRADDDDLANLKQVLTGRHQKLEVLFGAWCPVSREVVPRVLAVTEKLDGLVEADCIGVGMPVSEDPFAKEAAIREVPVVRIVGDESLLLFANDLKRVEQALAKAWVKP
jgi:hypothetical protein